MGVQAGAGGGGPRHRGRSWEREEWRENPEEVVKEERKLSKGLCLFSKGHTDSTEF